MIAKKSLGFSFFKLKSGAFTFSKFDVVYTYDILHISYFLHLFTVVLYILNFDFLFRLIFFKHFRKHVQQVLIIILNKIKIN